MLSSAVDSHARRDPHALDPVCCACLPDGQDTHVEAPLSLEYVPTSHGVQLAAPAAAYRPASHAVHTLEDVAPTMPEYVPASQGVHTNEVPEDAGMAYVPA